VDNFDLLQGDEGSGELGLHFLSAEALKGVRNGLIHLLSGGGEIGRKALSN
jgi:hypothetical protein